MPDHVYVRLGYIEAPLIRVLDEVAATLCEADGAIWAAATGEERDRYHSLADAVLRGHAIFDPGSHEDGGF